ncbi:MAG TPA: TRAP transporter small permease [Spirochaetota bacterium]|nr:TRAP transporter small permease [Spirochaetota bacterium]HNT13077.1 TRAP transporter small permease [Spirochaetota bacterium]
MNKLEYYLTRISDSFNVVAAAAVVLMMLVIIVDVVLRIVRVSVPGAYDLISLLGAVAIAFSLTYTSIQKGHIAVDFLYQKLPERWQAGFDVFNESVGAGFFTVLAWQCFAYAAALRAAGEVSLTVKLPVYPFVAGIGASCALLSLYLLLNLAKAIRRMVK